MSDFLKKIDSEAKFYIFNMQNFSQNHFSQQVFFEKPFLGHVPFLRYRLEEASLPIWIKGHSLNLVATENPCK